MRLEIQRVTEIGRRLLLHVRQDVAVSVQRYGDTGVSKTFAHHLGMRAKNEQDRGMGMPQIMESNPR